MKTQLLALVLLSVTPALASAETSRSLTIRVEGGRSDSLARAKLSYLDSCAKARREVQASALAPFVKSASCASAAIQEGPSLYRATGSLNVRLKRAMRIEEASLATGFSASESDARELWGRLCEDWKTSYNGNGGSAIVLESCGQPKLDLFYVKPEISSVALRVEKVRIAGDRGEYCRCRARDVESVEETPWGPRHRHQNVYDLMALVDAGFYEKQNTFTSPEECQDELVKSPLCSEQE